MKKIASLLMSIALASTAFAGPMSEKSSKGPVLPPPPDNCFGPGWDVGIYGAGFLPHHKDGDYKNSLGGGILAEYFFCENFGVQFSYTAVAASGTTHLFNGDLVLRAPLKSICLAPYLLVGGGLQVDGSKEGEYHAGVGLEYRMSGSKMSIFGDGTYNWHSKSNRELDFTLVRLGLKFRL